MSSHPFVRRGMALVPTTQDGRDAINRLEHGEEVIVSVRKARNVRLFRLFWALCQVVADNHPGVEDKEQAKRNLLRATGRVHLWFDVDGCMHEQLDSIAFENMRPDEFDEFFQAAVNVICRWLGTARQDVIDQVDLMVNPPRAATVRERKPRQVASPSIAPRADEDALGKVGRGVAVTEDR